MDKGLFTCNECESKGTDLKAVLDSMQSIKTEIGSIRQGQAEQQVEQEKVLESLKAVEAVAKKMDHIEAVQETHEDRLTTHDEEIRRNKQEREEGEKRIKKLEEKMQNIDQPVLDIRQINAVAREVREMEKRENNIVVFNVPESTEEDEDDQKTADLKKIKEIFKDMDLEEIKPTKISRTGKSGRYPKQILATIGTKEECEKIMKKCREGLTLKNDAFITRDRTFNQRKEAKLFRMEKEEGDGNAQPGDGNSQPGRENERGRGGRGRGRPRGRGGAGRGGAGRGGAGRGGAGGGGAGGESAGRGGGRGRWPRSESRKRQMSGGDDDDSKRRRMVGEDANAMSKAKPDQGQTTRPATASESELGAAGGADANF